MNYTIPRCMKRPGLIDRARTYFLELNEKGLYIIAIGPAGQKPHFPRETLVNVAAQALVKSYVNKMEQKMEEEILANEKRMTVVGMDYMAQEKHSYFVQQNLLELFKVKKEGDLVKVSIKGPKLSINLFAHETYLEKLLEMAAVIGKN